MKLSSVALVWILLTSTWFEMYSYANFVSYYISIPIWIMAFFGFVSYGRFITKKIMAD